MTPTACNYDSDATIAGSCQAPDCNGVCGGSAYTNSCGCVGGNTGVDPALCIDGTLCNQDNALGSEYFFPVGGFTFQANSTGLLTRVRIRSGEGVTMRILNPSTGAVLATAPSTTPGSNYNFDWQTHNFSGFAVQEDTWYKVELTGGLYNNIGMAYQTYPGGTLYGINSNSTNAYATFQTVVCPLVEGCTDATACNFDADANWNVPADCTYGTTWYADADGDGAGNPAVSQQACAQPQGYVATAGDGCPADGNKTAAGLCGCGAVDQDVDGDGLCDLVDGCVDLASCNYATASATACVYQNSCGECAPPTVLGCALASACNYNPAADCWDNATCEFTSCAGCMNPNACNFDAEATVSAPLQCTFPALDWEDCAGNCLPGADTDGDGICDAVDFPGCTDPAAVNFNPAAGTDDGSCFLVVVGCVIPSATNYDPAATVQGLPLTSFCSWPGTPPAPPMPMPLLSPAPPMAGLPPACTDTAACNYGGFSACEYTSCLGCSEASACNYDATALYNDGSCEWTSCAGCLNSSACDYDATATIAAACDFSSCQGCTNPAATNYDATATQDDGSCDVPGCTLAAACNYSAAATSNDGSCTFPALGYDCAGICYDTNGNTVCDVTEGFVAGCMDTDACNFSAAANLTDPASCVYLEMTALHIAVGEGAGAGATLTPTLTGGSAPYTLTDQLTGVSFAAAQWGAIPPARYLFTATDAGGCVTLATWPAIVPYAGCD
jgi:hypothetical protein